MKILFILGIFCTIELIQVFSNIIIFDISFINTIYNYYLFALYAN